MKLDLNDLVPAEAHFQLSANPTKRHTLKKFSLRATIWAQEKFGPDGLKDVFEHRNLPQISELAYYLLKDKTDFPTIDDFQEAINTQADRVALIIAILATIGMSQPLIDKLAKNEEPGNAQALPTGA